MVYSFNYSKQLLTIEQLDSLIYLDAIIKEVLRFSPSSYETVRTLIDNDRLQKNRISIV